MSIDQLVVQKTNPDEKIQQQQAQREALEGQISQLQAQLLGVCQSLEKVLDVNDRTRLRVMNMID